MAQKRWIALLCLFCMFACPALGEESQDVLVIKEFRNLTDLMEQIGGDLSPVVDITSSSIYPEKARSLMSAYPSKTFLCRLKALGHHIITSDEHLNIASYKYRDINALTEVMDLMPNLKQVTTLGRVFTAEELDELYARYPQVTDIVCKVKVGDHMVRTDRTAFSTRHASYTEDRHTQEDFKALRHCRGLVALDVGHNAITDLSFLELLPKLKILIVADNRFTDISPLANEPELEYLELINNRITDISTLTNCPKLVDLHIGWCDITDITPLYGLTQLDRIWLAKNPSPQEQVDHIRALMPDCTINDTAVERPTAEGWRTGAPHYKIIQKIFSSSKYIPFP